MKAVTLYRPGVFENVFGEFDRQLNSFFGDNFLGPVDRIFSRLPANNGLSVDVHETEKTYVIEAELPGFDEKDIEVRLGNNCLSIQSKKEEEKNEEPDRNYLIRERRISSFNRSFKLPENADSEGISASFKNGILTMEINKKAEAQQRVIPISKN
jgi:HSP20 family protein